MEENNEIQLLALIAKQPNNQQISGKKQGRGFFRRGKREHFHFLNLKILKYEWLKVYGVFSKYFPDIFNGFLRGGSVY